MNNFFYILFAGLFFLSSCTEQGVIFNQTKDFSDEKWTVNDTVTFNFNVDDSLNLYDVFVIVRNNENYRWSNLYLFTELTFPNKKVRKDTLEIVLTDQYGYWLGKNSGTYVTTLSKYISQRKFPLKGKYSLSFTHAMRTNDLNDISSIGIKVKSAKEQ